ncbi:ribosomal protein S5 domain 2-type protein [Limtongia smithiae]|uniref:ribosomal protein S5 domain 2-type protein n=1 Tax=Limtongia smithiae TaxID=1125753 RepID=UPI0034CE681F
MALSSPSAAPSPWTAPQSHFVSAAADSLPHLPDVEDLVPAAHALTDIYPSGAISAHQAARWAALRDCFRALYDRPISFVARTPGRVNLIGEHIDYSWFPVLPMAMPQDVLVAVAIVPDTDPAADERIVLSNVQSALYPTRVFNTRDFFDPVSNLPVAAPSSDNTPEIDWSSYFLTGLRGALTFSKLCISSSTTFMALPTMRILVDGEIPAPGLSASSALVCATLLAMLTAIHVPLVEKSFLFNSAAMSERALGMNSGGMDQAAFVYGLRDHAMLVDFRPLVSARPVRVVLDHDDTESPNLCFVLANTLVRVANRAETGPDLFNVRVVEATLAAEILARRYNVGRLEIRDGFGGTLRGFYDKVCQSEGWSMGNQASEEHAVREVVRRIREMFDREAYTLEETAEMLGISVQDMVSQYMTRFPIRAKKLNLRDRAVHVIEEQLRAKAFSALFASAFAAYRNHTLATAAPYFDALGSLMNASHDSLARLFECSCPEADALTKIARTHGAAGSRMTGIGWGGFTISIVQADRVEEVISALRTEFYDKWYPELTSEEIGRAVFQIEPANGTVLVPMENFKCG